MKANEFLNEYAGGSGIISNLRAAGRQNQADIAANIKQGAKNLAMKIPGAKTIAGIHSKISDFALQARDAADISRAADQWIQAWTDELLHQNEVRRRSGQQPMKQADYNKALETWLEQSLKVNADPAKMSQYVRDMNPKSLKNYFQQYFIPQYIKSQQQAGAAATGTGSAQQAPAAQQPAAAAEPIKQAFTDLASYIEQGNTITPKQRGELKNIWMSMGGTNISESRQLRISLYEGLTYNQVQSARLWESAGRRLVEADLTAQQISNIFAAVQKSATAAGGNRTMLGKGKDAAGAVADAWEDLKSKISKSGPIQNMDAKFDSAAEKLKQATGGDAGAMKYVQKYRDFAQKHPVAQSFLYAALIAAAGLSGAGLGGAAALGLFKMTDKLLQGEKFSSAAYQGAKTGALAYGASQVADLFRDGQPAVGAATSGPTAGLNQEQVDYLQKVGAEGNPMTVKGNTLWVERPEGPQSLTAPRGATADQMLKVAQSTAKNSAQDYMPPGSAYNALERSTDAASNTAQTTASAASNAGSSSLRNSKELLNSFAEKMGLQGTNHTADMVGGVPVSIDGVAVPQELYTPSQLNNIKAATALKSMQQNGLNESQVRQIFRRVERRQLAEGLMDTVKQAAGQAGQWVRTKGENLTTKVTADKLQQAWKAAGSPMDADAVAQIIRDAGVSDDVLNNVYQSLNIPLGQQPTQPVPGTAQTVKLDKILTTIKSYIDDGGKVTPQMRGAVKDAWMRSGGVSIAENKKKRI